MSSNVTWHHGMFCCIVCRKFCFTPRVRFQKILHRKAFALNCPLSNMSPNLRDSRPIWAAIKPAESKHPPMMNFQTCRYRFWLLFAHPHLATLDVLIVSPFSQHRLGRFIVDSWSTWHGQNHHRFSVMSLGTICLPEFLGGLRWQSIEQTIWALWVYFWLYCLRKCWAES